MKLRTTKRHIREGIKNIFRNGWMTVASVGAVTTTLLLVGTFLALMLNLNYMANGLEEDVQIEALIDLTAEEEQIQELGTSIKQMEGTDSVVFTSKDEQLNQLIEDMGKEGSTWQMFQQDNPLSHAYIVKAAQPNETEALANQIKQLDGIQEVNYGQDVIHQLFQFNEYARNIGLILIAALVFTAIFLISNTIKLTIMARSREIGIMKLVGATNGFIRWPFFIEGMLHGVLGAIIPITAVLTGYYYLDNNLKDQINYAFVELLPFNPFAWQLSLIILLIGTFIGIWGSVMSVRKFLKV
ncbi:MAG TPA: permease-like cell division protein FtsX [Lentibacillus sp.]|uniref:permease-like cell division protein FtsX n=1 Tax=Lentibacillus sp. TaxID=1925746 RepID=UPI002B4B72F3|nr:permease-like cell division protein FtsX [Lentibacillus sp.]HLR62374.1 permease-like cell division protein FtsX [Lentibacillus sp.]